MSRAPQFQATSRARSGALLVAAAERARRSGEDDRARRLLRRAVHADPNNVAAWRALADCYTGSRRAICLRWATEAEAARRAAPPPVVLHRRRYWLQRSITTAAALAVFGLAGGWAAVEVPYRDRILPGVFVNGVSVGGLSVTDARVRLAATEESRRERVVLLRAAGGEWGIPAGYLFHHTSDDAVHAAWLAGHEPNRLSRLRPRWAALTGQQTRIDQLSTNQAAIQQLVRQLAGHIDRAAEDARIVRDDAGWHVIADRGGLALDRAAAERAIESALQASIDDSTLDEPLAVELPVLVTPPRYSAADLAPIRDRLEALRRMPLRLTAGDHVWQVDRSTLVRWTLPDTGASRGGKHLVAPDPELIERQIRGWAAEVDQAPAPSQLQWTGDRITEMVAGRPGQVLDQRGAARVITAALLWDVHMVALPVQTIAPPPGEAEALGLVAEIGRGESQFRSYASPDRDANVQAGGQDVDGVVVPPGGVFSFSDTIGSITWDKGYRLGDMIENGQLRPTLGGGICQVSTTVFRAAFWSGLEIVEWHPHAWRLPWYEVDAPPGMDAAILLGGLDLKFRNNTEAHIVLWVVTDLDQKRQTVIIYGTPSNRRVEIASTGAGSAFQIERRVLAGDNVLAEDAFTSNYTQ